MNRTPRRTVVVATLALVAAAYLSISLRSEAADAPPTPCALPGICIDPSTLVVTCGVPIPQSCADFEASMTKVFIDSEAPAGVPPSLVNRLRAMVNGTAWAQGQKITKAHRKLIVQLEGVLDWFDETYFPFKAYQPGTESTGQLEMRTRPKAVNGKRRYVPPAASDKVRALVQREAAGETLSEREQKLLDKHTSWEDAPELDEEDE